MEKKNRLIMAPTTKVLTPSRVLFVDDDPDQLDFYALLFQRDSFQMLTAPSALHALQILRAEHSVETPIHLVVSDYQMIGMTGIDLLDAIARDYPAMGRVLLTGHADSELVLESRRHKLLTKGMDHRLIHTAILRELRRHGG